MILKEINVHTILGEDYNSPVDQARVSNLAESIKVSGLLCPIGVRKSGFVNNNYSITYGRHRLAAFKLLGRGTIPCVVFAVNEDLGVDDLYAELAMIDENLIRGKMTAAEIASATARRKAIYLELHPETGAGVAGGLASGRARGSDRTTPDSGVASFVEATASATGLSESAIYQNARRGRLGEDALRRVEGTTLDSGRGLDSLLALSVDGSLTPEGEARLSEAEAARDAPSPAPRPRQIASQLDVLCKAWGKASEDERQRFKEYQESN